MPFRDIDLDVNDVCETAGPSVRSPVGGLDMSKDVILYHQPPSDQLHPLVYKMAVGLVLCFVIAAWIFFDRQRDIGELLGFASGLLLVAIVLPFVLWRVWRREQEQPVTDGTRFRHWAARDFDVWEARLKGSHAAIDVLLPLASVAIGLTALGIVFALVAATS
jgi:uncharacterized membrane protein YjgN (DUF898 family)